LILDVAKPAYGPEFLGEQALLPSEDRQKYEQLFDDVRTVINPKDVFEEHWVLDATHQIWEAFRFRRLAAQVLTSVMRAVLEKTLRPIIDAEDAREPVPRPAWSPDTAERLAVRYMQRDQVAVEKVNSMLNGADITQGMLEAEAATMRSLDLQRISALLAKAESRRNATLKAIERHREGLGAQLRDAAEKFEMNEFETPRAKSTQKRAA